MPIEYGTMNEAAVGIIVDATPILPLTAEERHIAMMVPRVDRLLADYVATIAWPEALAVLVTKGIYEQQQTGDYVLTPLGRVRYHLTNIVVTSN